MIASTMGIGFAAHNLTISRTRIHAVGELPRSMGLRCCILGNAVSPIRSRDYPSFLAALRCHSLHIREHGRDPIRFL